MRQLTLLIGALLILATPLFAQDNYQIDRPAQSEPVKQWTSNFNIIDVDCKINLTLIKIGANDAPYIIYDTKDGDPTKFTAEIEKGGILKIRERADSKRLYTTEVQVYFNELSDIKIAKATTNIEGVLDTPLLDITISNDAYFVARVKCLDLVSIVTGKSVVILNGETLYHTAQVSTAEYNAAGLSSVSTDVSASHNAMVRVDASQRLIAKSSTGGNISYKSSPEIYRCNTTLFGGEIGKM